MENSTQYSYGTSGFRYDAKTMFQISERIGFAISAVALSYCSVLPAVRRNLGFIITASHNPYQDNGIKMVTHCGDMIDQEHERLMEDIVNGKQEINEYIKKNNIHVHDFTQCRLFVATDTRESGKILKEQIINAILKIIQIDLIDLGYRTTPEFHYIVANCSGLPDNHDGHHNPHGYDQYVEYVKDMVRKYEIYMKGIFVDCANGVGALTMMSIDTPHNAPCMLNVETNKYMKLNEKCGSDYVANNPDEYYKKHMKSGYYTDNMNKLYASFDGDADRIIFHYYDDEGIRIMDGDHISALILQYILNVALISRLHGCDKISIGVIHTGYSNGGYIRMVDDCIGRIGSSMIDVKRIVVPTGVKNLITEAKKYDIGIYYESNGHGSVIIRNDHGIDGLKMLSDMFNQIVGDGIMNLFSIVAILRLMDLTPAGFHSMFAKRESRTVKINVKDKNIYKTSHCQTKLLEPISIVTKFTDIVGSEHYTGGRAFIRPSGTENVLRLYVENNRHGTINLDHMVDEIKQILY